MLVSVLSDIHLEHYSDPNKAIAFLESVRPTEIADVLVLAGDIWSLNQRATFRYLDEFRKWAVDIVYVPGNHECYGTNPTLQGRDTLKGLYAEGLRVLGPGYYESFTYEGHRFVGSTCWYPDTPIVRKNLKDWSDVSFTRGFIKWWERFQLEERKYLWDTVQGGDIVVSHMLPTWECISPQFEGSSANCLYVADLKDLILEKKPSLWIHGHSHDKFELTLGDTRILRSPIGYPSDLQKETKILELRLDSSNK